jgi:hypothetical protein
MSLAKYKVYCNDEAKYVNGWSEGEPTTCFNDNTHVIDTDKTAIIELVNAHSVSPYGEGKVMIEQTTKPTSQSFYVITNNYLIPAATSVEVSIPILFDCDMYNVQMMTDMTHNKGDTFDAYMNKNTLVGGVIAPCTNDSILKVSSTVVATIKAGYYIRIGVQEQYYQVIANDGVDSITVDGIMSANPGDLVYLTYFMMKDKQMGNLETLGETIFNPFPLVKGTMGGVLYHNSSGYSKNLSVNVYITF